MILQLPTDYFIYYSICVSSDVVRKSIFVSTQKILLFMDRKFRQLKLLRSSESHYREMYTLV
jgi:hypothetical protein